jgi:small subunit ribosomal protein S21
VLAAADHFDYNLHSGCGGVISEEDHRPLFEREGFLCDGGLASQIGGEQKLRIRVDGNKVEAALKVMKKTLAKEGTLSEARRRQYYEKPCEERKRKERQAAKVRRRSQGRGEFVR